MAGINRFGPFVQRGRTYARLDADDDVLTIGMNRALTLLEEKGGKGGRRGGGTASAGKTLGEHPEDGKPIELRDGRFGPYLKWNKLNASLPKGTDPETLAFDEAVEILAQKAAKSGAKPAKGKAKSTTAKSAGTKGTAAKSTKSTKDAGGKGATSKGSSAKSGGAKSGGKAGDGGRQTGS
jgi:DNA topoisomerase-1